MLLGGGGKEKIVEAREDTMYRGRGMVRGRGGQPRYQRGRGRGGRGALGGRGRGVSPRNLRNSNRGKATVTKVRGSRIPPMARVNSRGRGVAKKPSSPSVKHTISNMRQSKPQRKVNSALTTSRSGDGRGLEEAKSSSESEDGDDSSEVSDSGRDMDDETETTANRDERHSQYMERTASTYEKQAHELFIRIKSPDKKGTLTTYVHEDNTFVQKKDRFGFIIEEGNEWYASLVKLKPEKVRLHNTRLEKWRAMTKKGLGSCSNAVIKSRVRKGLPQPLRGKIWSYLCGAKILEKAKGDLYEKLQNIEVATTESSIIVDVQRTFSSTPHVLFETNGGLGQERLFHILRAVSVYDETLGYCNGMNNIVAFLLMFLNEKNAFFCFISLLKGHRYKLRGLYLDGMPGMMIALHTLDRLLEKQLPKVYGRFQEEHIDVHMFATSWIRTMFVTHFPIELVVRIWDIFFSEGWKIVYRVILALLKYGEITLLNDTYAHIIDYLDHGLAKDISGKHDLVLKIAFDKIKFKTEELEIIEMESTKVVGEHGHLS